ncbi:MAG TPA: DNA-binding domain-containing protein [Usitatibacteraceae bacterium]
MLHDLQSAFAGALLGADGSAAGPAIRAGALTAARRLEIYRYNVLANLRGALADIYPVVQAIVGEAFFRHAAEQFIRVCPSRSGDLNQFGQDWAAFLATYPHARDLPYLADVAKLEWAWHESFHAADHAAFDLARLSSVAPEQHGRLRFQLHSSVRLLSSGFPLFHIWEVNQPGYGGAMELDWTTGGDHLLIHRQGVEVSIHRLEPAAWKFLRALSAGAELEQAAEQALEADAEFDLQGFLLQSVQCDVIVNFTGSSNE